MNNNYYDTFKKLGLNISYYRREQNITQEALAEIVGISRLHLSRIENASVSASLSIIFAIADALQIPVKSLFEFRN